MAFLREHYAKQIADWLHLLANMLKTRTRANLTDANHSLETVMLRFFNALYRWELVNLNAEHQFPAADIGDRKRSVAMQITNENAGEKIIETATAASRYGLQNEFQRLVIFFLLEKKPAMPKSFVQPDGCPQIECLDITDLLKQTMAMGDFDALKHAAAVLDEEMSRDITPSSLHRYYIALSENFSTYENLGLPPPANAEGEKDVRIAIRGLFVEPSWVPARVSPEEFDAALLEGKNPATPLLPLLAGKERRFVLLADPGMGKSTLIQWLITTLAEEAPLPASAAGLRGAIPLPFILRDIVGHMPKEAEGWNWPTLLNAFVRYHPRSADRPPLAAALVGDEAGFRTLLGSDRAFFLIDGVDEIGDPASRRGLRNALWEGFELYPNARWLVTSRWVGYNEAVVHESPWESYGCGGHRAAGITKHATLLYLAPFDDVQQLTFAQHWYFPRMGDVLGKEHATSFVKAVCEHDSVRVIGRVPNLLYLLALLYRNRARLPHGRTHVYAAISEAYLEGIDLTKHLRVPYELAKKERLLATIARHMQERRMAESESESDKKKQRRRIGEILVKRGELEQWLAPDFPGDSGHAALHAFIRYIAARSGLLLPRGEGIFGFAHLSFQEYYAACWLEEEFRRLLNAQARGSGGGFLRRNADPEPVGSLRREDFAALGTQPVWREALVFLVEKLSANANDTVTLIDWLFPQLAQEPVAVEGEEPPELMPIEAARLLAAFSLDPQVSLTQEQRKDIWAILWKAHLAQQDGRMEWHLAPAILATSEFQPLVWASLASIQPDRLLLCYTSITDLTPLTNLAQLSSLDLHDCKGVDDITPLARLIQLQSLWLDGCAGVTDLTPLAHLPQMKSLNLSNCTAAGDLSPLAQLTMLESLHLKGCTRVTDLAPLGHLPELKKLWLDGCTGLSPGAVAAFRNSHPTVEVSPPTTS